MEKLIWGGRVKEALLGVLSRCGGGSSLHLRVHSRFMEISCAGRDEGLDGGARGSNPPEGRILTTGSPTALPRALELELDILISNLNILFQEESQKAVNEPAGGPETSVFAKTEEKTLKSGKSDVRPADLSQHVSS